MSGKTGRSENAKGAGHERRCRTEPRDHRPRTPDHGPRRAPPAAVADGLLLRRLSRPRERRLRLAHHEQGAGLQLRGLWFRRRHFLPRLLHIRSPQQHPARQGRRARLDRPHPDHLGHHLRLHRARFRPALLLFRPLPARPRRGRLLPRHHPLSDLVVPVLLPLAHRRHLHGGDPAIQHSRLPRLRLPARSRRSVWHRRLAMAVYSGGGTSGHPRRRRSTCS